MIITRIMGGLGNQMFQYAIGRSLSLSTEQELRLDLTDMERYKLRGFALPQFRIEAGVAREWDIPKKRRGLRGLLVRALALHRNVVRVDERTFSFDPEILLTKGEAYLCGYWQSEKYFSRNAQALRSDFQLSGDMSSLRQSLLQRIRQENSVSVHVRRGDYVTNPAANAIHGTCEPEWYAAAMSRMEERFGDVTYFVFSDDPVWAREKIKSRQRMVFIEPQTDSRDAEDMHLMAACRCHIVANSSFSWWGAWLGRSPDKHVVAPLRWFRDPNKDTRDLIPDSWEKL